MKGGIKMKKALQVPTRSATPKISFTQEKIKYVGIFGVKIRVRSDKTKVYLRVSIRYFIAPGILP